MPAWVVAYTLCALGVAGSFGVDLAGMCLIPLALAALRLGWSALWVLTLSIGNANSNHRGHDQQLPGVVLASLCGACSSLVLPRLTREPSTHLLPSHALTGFRIPQ